MQTYKHTGRIELDYIDVVDYVNSKKGEAPMNGHERVIIHYSWDPNKGNIIERIKTWGTYHGGSVPYHFVIPRDDEFANPTVIMAQDEDAGTWHCSNYIANLNSLAVCIDGQYNASAGGKDVLSKRQLAILQQLLDNFKNSGNKDCHVYNIDTHDSVTTVPYTGSVASGQGRVLGHKEIAVIGEGTACPGDIQTYIDEWFNKSGKVAWIDDYLSNITPVTPTVPQVNPLELDKLQAEVDRLNSEVMYFKDRAVTLEQDKQRLQDTISSLKTQLSNVVIPADLSGEVEKLNAEITRVKEESSSFQAQLNGCLGEKKTLSEKLQSVSKHLLPAATASIILTYLLSPLNLPAEFNVALQGTIVYGINMLTVYLTDNKTKLIEVVE